MITCRAGPLAMMGSGFLSQLIASHRSLCLGGTREVRFEIGTGQLDKQVRLRFVQGARHDSRSERNGTERGAVYSACD